MCPQPQAPLRGDPCPRGEMSKQLLLSLVPLPEQPQAPSTEPKAHRMSPHIPLRQEGYSSFPAQWKPVAQCKQMFVEIKFLLAFPEICLCPPLPWAMGSPGAPRDPPQTTMEPGRGILMDLAGLSPSLWEWLEEWGCQTHSCLLGRGKNGWV